MIDLSIKKISQCKNEMKLGFGGKIWTSRIWSFGGDQGRRTEKPYEL
jgi:hypothetical protein